MIERTGNSNLNITRQQAAGGDIKDNQHDEERMQPEEVILDLPDVKDIPGQEHVHVPQFGEMADTTISSADEEGEGLFDDDDDDSVARDDSNEVRREEKEFLEDSSINMNTEDDLALKQAAVDNVDSDGELLNEASGGNTSAIDLDVPGSEADDLLEEVGEEDEENNLYSLDDNETGHTEETT